MYEIEHLSWRVDQKQVFDKINFSVFEQESVGLIGPNGAGKSSLLRCLYGKQTPSAGTILFRQQPLQQYSRRELAQQVAVVLQEPSSELDLCVVDVIRMGLTPHKRLLSFDSREDDERILHAAVQVDLTNQLAQSFHSLSGGEKQRALIARAMVQQPKVLIMDEPTNHLDIRHQIEILQLAKQMRITLIISLHDLNLAAAFCDRLILMNQGKIVADGSPASVLTQPILAEVFAVDTQVDQHPFHPGPRINYNFGNPGE